MGVDVEIQGPASARLPISRKTLQHHPNVIACQMEYRIFDKTFSGIFNTVNQQYVNERKALKTADKQALIQNRSYFISKDNKKKQELNKGQYSRKHPLYGVDMIPP